MEDNKGLISIIVPVYNVEKYLDRCIASLVNQTYSDIEIILVDDGSTDSSSEIIDRYCEKYNQVRVYHKANGGLSDARNYGLEKAGGEYILYVDSDDYVELNACEILMSRADDVDIVVGVAKMINNDEVELIKHTNLETNKIYTSEEYLVKCLKVFELWSPAWLNMYKRKFLIQNKLFYKLGIYYEDTQILIKMFSLARTIKYIDYPFYNYIIRDNSITTNSKSRKKIADSIEIYNDWMKDITKIDNPKVKELLYAFLIKMYLHDCRTKKIVGWKINEVNWRFAFKYAKGFKEKLKVLYFTCFPKLYIR